MKPIPHKFRPHPSGKDECDLCGNRKAAHKEGEKK